MSTLGSHVLLGNSVRYLAQSGQRADVRVIALDRFADQDTQIAAAFARGLPEAKFERMAEVFRELQLPRDIPWSYAAGFEQSPEGLSDLLLQYPRLLGNSPKVLRLLSDARRLFPLLDVLHIDYPEVVFAPPPDLTGWLYKASARQGGMAVQSAQQAPWSNAGFYQRRLSGKTVSLLFAADAQEARPIGFNRIGVVSRQQADFRFARVLSGYVPAPSLAGQMLQAARRLTRALALRGVNGLDFMLHGGKAWLLDINARPPASLELYEAALPRGGLLTHLDACEGRLPVMPQSAALRGMEIVYAPARCRFSSTEWPEWVSDRPADDSQVEAGHPLASVHASAPDLRAVALQLRQRRRDLLASIVYSSEVAA